MRGLIRTTLLLAMAGCTDSAPAERQLPVTAAATATSAECFGMFAAATHAACEEEGASDCAADGPFETASAARDTSLRDCLASRSDPGSACASIEAAGCPPGLSDAECTAARERAVSVCDEAGD
jgi:hypothetical protein